MENADAQSGGWRCICMSNAPDLPMIAGLAACHEPGLHLQLAERWSAWKRERARRTHGHRQKQGRMNSGGIRKGTTHRLEPHETGARHVRSAIMTKIINEKNQQQPPRRRSAMDSVASLLML
mmetsp:Transcript_80514/g.180137  ORF Transcript_80514/g.180137 Transcript_80514/m.180137 type:complete len:122 (-) Transcript_80514:247-612(-)